MGATLLSFTDVFSAGAREAAVLISMKSTELGFTTLLIKGAFAGFIVAGVVWIDYATKDNSSRFLMTYLSFLAIPLAGLNHVVVTATEMVFLFHTTGYPILISFMFTVLPVLMGNIIGGVFFVTFVNYFQTPSFIKDNHYNRLPLKQWLFSFDTYLDLKRK